MRNLPKSPETRMHPWSGTHRPQQLAAFTRRFATIAGFSQAPAFPAIPALKRVLTDKADRKLDATILEKSAAARSASRR